MLVWSLAVTVDYLVHKLFLHRIYFESLIICYL